ncbi:hypothetical protein [Bacillus pumilus]
MVCGMGGMKYGKGLEKEEEIVVKIGDMVNEIFGGEWGIVGSEKGMGG